MLRFPFRRLLSTNTTTTKAKPQRPTSPHLTIYQPQLTWYLSSAFRITGVMYVGIIYGFGLGYLLFPKALSIDSLIKNAKKIPNYVAIPLKFTLAAPFWFHNFNGIRHLMWDNLFALTLKGVYGSGYAVLGATTVASAVCAAV